VHYLESYSTGANKYVFQNHVTENHCSYSLLLSAVTQCCLAAIIYIPYLQH